MSLCKEYAQNDREFVKNFRNIDVKKTGLWVRWLWPDHVEEAELDRELKALSDAGIAGAEIGLHAMGTTWGTDEYFQSLILAMRSAKKYGMKLDFCERPLRAQTPMGERVSIAKSESVPAGTTAEFEIECLDPKLEDMVRECLDYGAKRGLGQWRNSGKGQGRK